LIKKNVDSVHYLNLGKNGNEVQLLKYLPTMNIAQYENIETLKAKEENADISEESVDLIRLIKPEEAVEVSRSVYTSYGHTYVNEAVYYPEHVRALNADKTMQSAFAISENGNIAGHVAIFKPHPDSKITEWGMAVVKHAYRGKGIMNKLVTFILDHAEACDLDGVFAHCVTEHVYTQKICDKYGFADVTALLAYSPSTVKFKKMNENLSQRQTIIQSFKYFKNPGTVSLPLPRKHREIITDLYYNLGVSVNDTYEPLIDNSGEAEIFTEIYSARNIGVITIKNGGKNLVDAVKTELRRLCFEQLDVIYLYINLEDPEVTFKCQDFENQGFFFSGILPGYPFKHTLILQYLNNIEIDFSKIAIWSEQARLLLDYVKKSKNENK